MSGDVRLIGGSRRVHKYVGRRAETLKESLIPFHRISLNVMMALSLFIAPLLPVCYYLLLGWGGMALGLLLMSFMAILGAYAALGSASSWFFLPALAVYLGAWIGADRIFKRLEAQATYRVGEIDAEDPPTTSGILEKGILLKLVREENDSATGALRSALSSRGGDAPLWYLAGVAFGKMGRFSEATAALDRAAEKQPDRKLRKGIVHARNFYKKKDLRSSGEK